MLSCAKCRARVGTMIVLAVTLSGTSRVTAESITIESSRDDTVYERGRDLSNGSGRRIFVDADRLGSRRGLITFDVAAAIPDGARIEPATLTLQVTALAPFDADIALHRMLASWGEEGSMDTSVSGPGALAREGDATWTQSHFDRGCSGGRPAATSRHSRAPSRSTAVPASPLSWSTEAAAGCRRERRPPRAPRRVGP